MIELPIVLEQFSESEHFCTSTVVQIFSNKTSIYKAIYKAIFILKLFFFLESGGEFEVVFFLRKIIGKKCSFRSNNIQVILNIAKKKMIILKWLKLNVQLVSFDNNKILVFICLILSIWWYWTSDAKKWQWKAPHFKVIGNWT